VEVEGGRILLDPSNLSLLLWLRRFPQGLYFLLDPSNWQWVVPTPHLEPEIYFIFKYFMVVILAIIF